MSVSILLVKDKSDSAELFSQRVRLERRQGSYVYTMRPRAWRLWTGYRRRSSRC
jgi:hypothetical protein